MQRRQRATGHQCCKETAQAQSEIKFCQLNLRFLFAVQHPTQVKDHDRKQIRGKAEEIEQQIGQKCADTANAVLHVTTRRRLAKARIGGIVGKERKP